MQYEKIILNMLVLSEFSKLETNSSDKHVFLMIEPLIIDILDGVETKTHKNILDDLNSFKPDSNTIYNLLEKYKDDKIITHKDNNLYSLNESEKVKEKKSKYDKIRTNKKYDWNALNNHALSIISKSEHTKINAFNIAKHFFKFYTHILYTDLISTSIFDKSVNIEIGLFLEECAKNENLACFSVMEDLLQGLFRTRAVVCGAKGLDKDNLPVIYLDNVFIGNLFGWSDNIHHYSCKMIFEQLKLNGFKLKIHYETFDIIRKSIMRYRKMISNGTPILCSTYFHYMKNIEPNNTVFNINNIPLTNMQNALIDKLKEYDIVFNTNELDINIDNLDSKYTEIENTRKQINDTYYVSEEQTNYDYKIIKNYETNASVVKNTLNNMNEIFLTYQKVIVKSAYNNFGDTSYTPIMSVRKFSKLLLLENSIDNSNNSKLLQAIIKDAYSNDLSKTIIDFLTKVFKDAAISDSDKDLLVAHSLDTNNWNDIIVTDSINDILEDLKSKDEKIKQVEDNTKKALDDQSKQHRAEQDEKVRQHKAEQDAKNIEHVKILDDKDIQHKAEIKKIEDNGKKKICYFLIVLAVITFLGGLLSGIIEYKKTGEMVLGNYIITIILFFIGTVLIPIINKIKPKK